MTRREFQYWLADMGLSPAEAATTLGISRATVYHYLNGETNVAPVVAKLCKALAEQKGTLR
jgi:predicted transcriptional regulator